MKISVSKGLETAKYLVTKAGQELSGLIQYLGQFTEEVLRTLKNGITFADNQAGEIKIVKLTHGEDQVVQVSKPVAAVTVRRVVATGEVSTGVNFWYDGQGRLTVRTHYHSATSTPLECHLYFEF